MMSAAAKSVSSVPALLLTIVYVLPAESVPASGMLVSYQLPPLVTTQIAYAERSAALGPLFVIDTHLLKPEPSPYVEIKSDGVAPAGAVDGAPVGHGVGALNGGGVA